MLPYQSSAYIWGFPTLTPFTIFWEVVSWLVTGSRGRRGSCPQRYLGFISFKEDGGVPILSVTLASYLSKRKVGFLSSALPWPRISRRGRWGFYPQHYLGLVSLTDEGVVPILRVTLALYLWKVGFLSSALPWPRISHRGRRGSYP